MCELKSIIDKDNPFNESLLKDWRKRLDAFNQGAGEHPLPCFKRDADSAWIDEYQRKYEKKGKGLHLELLPDPFRGDPRAPVWILLLNPGYSEVDRYDHLGLCPLCGKRLVRVDGKATSHENGCATRFFGSGLSDVSASLKSRQDMLIEELKLDLSKPRKFLWFEPDFHTVPEENATVAGKGGSLWWKEFLFGDGDSDGYLLPNCDIKPDSGIGSRLFALEAFPYHSNKFDSSFLQNQNFRDSDYYGFWCSLVGWAVESGRKVIVRYESIRKVLEGVIGKAVYANNKENIISMASINPSLTIGNLCGKNCSANSMEKVGSLRKILLQHE